MPVLDFVPLKTVDALMSGGGSPDAKSAPATFEKPQPLPPAPEVKPAPVLPEKIKEPDPPKEPVRDVSPPKDPEPTLEPAKDHKRPKPTFDFTPVTHPTRDPKAEAKAKAEAQAREEAREYARQEEAWRHRASAAFGSAGNSLAEGRIGSVEKVLLGPGGGGVPYANFYQSVKSIYERAWIVPDGITDDNATVGTEITIARDGTVVSARITRSSRNAAVDRSVQVTLDRVKVAVPLPESEKANQRTVGINFSVAAKRAVG